MKRITSLATILCTVLFLAAPAVHAADTWHEFPAQHAIKSPLGQKKLLPDIRLYMKGKSHPAAVKKFGEFKSNQRSNKFRRSTQEACDVAFLSGLIALQKRAQREGGNAVVDIYSITKNQKYVSAENFKCIAGRMITNVALMGTVVKLRH